MGLTSMIMSPNRFGSPRFTQGSVLNLNNIDEIQNPINFHLPSNKPAPPHPPTRPSSSNMMNNPLDDYLKSVANTDDQKFNQKFMLSNVSSSSSSSSPESSASVNLNRTLSNTKAVNEVWNQDNNSVGEANDESIEPKALGDQSIEEFLINNGAINPVNNQEIALTNPSPLISIDPMGAGSTQQPDWLQYPMAPHMGIMPCLPVSGSIFGNQPVVDVGYADNQLSAPMSMNVAPLSDSQEVAEKKRKFSNEMMEKTIERRQKRMIKNRESAARSRAKKQAYTNELESKVAALTKEKDRLIKEKEAMMLLRVEPKPCPEKHLRRSFSAKF